MDGDRGMTVKVAKAGKTVIVQDTSEEAGFVKTSEKTYFPNSPYQSKLGKKPLEF